MGISALERERKNIGLIMIFPSVLLFIAFKFYPIFNSIRISFTNWSLYINDADFVGLKNYLRVFQRMPNFWKALVVNLKYSLSTTILQLILGFLMAYLLYGLTKHWKSFFKVVFYLPVILPSATLGVMWGFLLSPDYGLVNVILRSVNLDFLTHAWLAEQGTALGSVIFVTIWKYSGFTMIIYFVSMLNIPKEVLESARIDGAGRLSLLTHFFMPLTIDATEINFILTMIGGMKAFDMFYLLTAGGPGIETQVTALLIYKHAFAAGRIDRASAMAVIVLIIVMTMTVFGRKLIQHFQYD